MRTSSSISRRNFLTGASGAALLSGAPAILHAENKGEKLRLAFIGAGGIGRSHASAAEKHGDVCNCFSDVDVRQWGNVRKRRRWSKARGYQDYRVMLEKEVKNFDAVMIGTPDHHHFPATILAMQLGKHVYTQKPLTHTVWEARQLGMAKRQYQVATQMGNQGHANEGNRLIVEWIRQNAIGPVREVHCWTNRPVWPQPVRSPEGSDPVPKELNWDVWLGPAPARPFVGNRQRNKRGGAYHQFNWRGWWDFGAGALGDMACHTMDCVFWAMEPGAPVSVEVVKAGPMPEGNFPGKSVLKFRFPARHGRRAFDFYWHDGGFMPAHPRDLPKRQKLPNTGALFVGEKASIMSSGDYGNSPRIIPEPEMKEIGKPKREIPRSPGHYEEWRMACFGEKPLDFPGSNFDYAVPFTETVLLGNVALRAGGRIDWDAENFLVTNNPKANSFIHKEYRKGWDFGAARA